MGTEWIQNGYRTGTGTRAERKQNVFCQAFLVRFLLIGTVLKAIVSCMPLFFLALSSGILERLVQMIDNISKDIFHCVFIIKKQPLQKGLKYRQM